MRIEYKTAALTPAGFRPVYVIALAEKISAKRCRVTEILEIDGETPKYGMSRTGANRQRYNGLYIAEAEVGKKKNLGALFAIHNEVKP